MDRGTGHLSGKEVTLEPIILLPGKLWEKQLGDLLAPAAMSLPLRMGLDKSWPEHLPQGAEGRMRPDACLSHIVSEELIQSCVLDHPPRPVLGAHSRHPTEAWRGGHKHCIPRKQRLRGIESLARTPPANNCSQARISAQARDSKSPLLPVPSGPGRDQEVLPELGYADVCVCCWAHCSCLIEMLNEWVHVPLLT